MDVAEHLLEDHEAGKDWAKIYLNAALMNQANPTHPDHRLRAWYCFSACTKLGLVLG